MEALSSAVLQHDTARFKQLAAGANSMSLQDEEKRTALMIAAMYGNLDAIKIALACGADVNHEDLAGRTAFLIAAGEGHTSVLEHLLTIDPSQIDACTHSGNTALHRAAAYGHAPVIRVLLRAGAEIDSANEESETPLLRACRWGHEDAARLLRQAGADATLTDKNGRTPAAVAVEKGFAEVGAILSNEKPLPSVLAQTANIAKLISAGLLPPNTTASSSSGSSSSPLGKGGNGAGGASSNGAGFSGSANSASNNPNDDEDDGYGSAEYYDDGSGGGLNGGQPVRVEGWMAKQGHFIRNWKNRWFTLEGRRMTYFAKEGATKAKGAIVMGPGTDVIIEEKYAKPFCFTLVTPTKKFILQAANEDELVEWIEAIQANLECCPSDDEGAGSAASGED